VIDARPRIVRLRDGLVDAAALRAALAGGPRAVLLFGHLHRRLRYTLRTASGTLDVIAAGGAALDHPEESVRAGFNLYEIDDTGRLASIDAYVVDPGGGGFERTSIDRIVVCEERP
jgi:hypothetical protein